MAEAIHGIGCDCITKINEGLVEHRIEINPAFDINTGQLYCVVRTCDIKNPDSRRKMPMVVATYCPFCGRKYVDA